MKATEKPKRKESYGKTKTERLHDKQAQASNGFS
jgi:hypothetical protein